MKAFCFRSGHVFIGPSVPAGAVELADHDNEAELLHVVGRNTYQLCDAEGCPQTVSLHILLAKDGIDVELSLSEVIEAFEDDLARIKKDPLYMSNCTPGPIVLWPSDPSEPGEVSA